MVKFSKLCITFIALLSLIGCEDKQKSDSKRIDISVAEATDIAVEAYIYAYPLITSEITRVQSTNVPSVEKDSMHAPMGQFINVKRYPPADFRGITAANADTLYSVAWVDVSNEPWVFSHPDMQNRFYLFPIYSMWTPVIESPGTRTTGDAAATYALTGPHWHGTLPEGVKEIKSPTTYVLILGRTYSSGTEVDYEAVNKLQEQYLLYPLSSYGKPYKSPAISPVDKNVGYSMTDKPQAIINAMDISTYFNMMTKLMGSVAPAPKEDIEQLDNMAKIGIIPGQPFEIGKLSQEVQNALQNVNRIVMDKINTQVGNNGGVVQNGWLIPSETGNYGTNYLDRATVAAFGWGANLTADAVYPYTSVDATGAKLVGANKYILHFDANQLPPAKGFWSITMYQNEDGLWFYPNIINKFTVSMRDNLVFNDDGSLDLYFQHESPGIPKEANWLPAPEGEFTLMLRIYWPSETAPSILPPGKGSWVIPAVKKVS